MLEDTILNIVRFGGELAPTLCGLGQLRLMTKSLISNVVRPNLAPKATDLENVQLQNVLVEAIL